MDLFPEAQNGEETQRNDLKASVFRMLNCCVRDSADGLRPEAEENLRV